MRTALAAMVLLAGCITPEVPKRPDLSKQVQIGFRNPTAPIGGTSRFDAHRFSGDWVTVECLGKCTRKVRYVQATDGVYLREAAGETRGYVITAPGVLRAQGSGAPLVIMWVDEGFRTAVVGDADGKWAAIIDRRAASSPDRLRAAREILDFNGWDVSRIKKVKQ